jgi:hypothetical protein
VITSRLKHVLFLLHLIIIFSCVASIRPEIPDSNSNQKNNFINGEMMTDF